MDANMRFLISQVREDIAGLKVDIVKVLDQHETEIEELKRNQTAWAGKIAGGAFVLVLVIEVGAKIVSGIFR